MDRPIRLLKGHPTAGHAVLRFDWDAGDFVMSLIGTRRQRGAAGFDKEIVEEELPGAKGWDQRRWGWSVPGTAAAVVYLSLGYGSRLVAADLETLIMARILLDDILMLELLKKPVPSQAPRPVLSPGRSRSPRPQIQSGMPCIHGTPLLACAYRRPGPGWCPGAISRGN